MLLRKASLLDRMLIFVAACLFLRDDERWTGFDGSCAGRCDWIWSCASLVEEKKLRFMLFFLSATRLTDCVRSDSAADERCVWKAGGRLHRILPAWNPYFREPIQSQRESQQVTWPKVWLSSSATDGANSLYIFILFLGKFALTYIAMASIPRTSSIGGGA